MKKIADIWQYFGNIICNTIYVIWQNTPCAIWSRCSGLLTAGVGSLRPAWTFEKAHIRIFVTQFRVQSRV